LTAPPRSVETLHGLCPSVPRALVEAHLARLQDDYFEAFPAETIARHLDALALLSAEQPAQVRFEAVGEGRVTCTVLAFDQPSEFALITGCLAAHGFQIESGQVFTYAEAQSATLPSRRPGRGPARRPRIDPLRRRRIVDCFTGRIDTGWQGDRQAWETSVEATLTEVLGLLGEEKGRRKARTRINEMVATRLEAMPQTRNPALYPVDLDIVPQSPDRAELTVISEDTPAFLYTLSNALALLGVSIERVLILTEAGRVKDTLVVRETAGRRLDSRRLDQIKLSVLLTKQFTYCLGQAPDTFAALTRFETLTEDLSSATDRDRWLELFDDPRRLRDLAAILGASDFIWEDFIRYQYEELLPILAPGEDAGEGDWSREAMATRLARAVPPDLGFEAAVEALNAFKDREIYRIDLNHILRHRADVRALARPLTELAALVVAHALTLATGHLAARYGRPRTVGGLECRLAVLGLGKFGGLALGYASDIELLFVFDDNGTTDGDEPIGSAEYFERVVECFLSIIHARHEGVFEIDLRLRPHGKSGPKAVSLAAFCDYYDKQGPALPYERLALTRLRAVAGDRELGRRVERLRDDFIYTGARIDAESLRQLRERQYRDKSGGRLNAKFSPGALVDIEYYVQMLQVTHGAREAALRTPRIHQALEALSAAGVLAPDESGTLTGAYYFLRHLINGLRMLRGNARDLFLPDMDAPEFLHLARRMGYEGGGELPPERQLRLDFETQTAVVRAFIERHFGRDTLPDQTVGNAADLILSEAPPPALRDAVLGELGFADPRRALVNLRSLAGRHGDAAAFARLAVLACDALRHSPDPDMALNNWERFAGAGEGGAGTRFEAVLAQPRRLDILLAIMGGSQFLADTLIRNPGFFDWVTDPAMLHGRRTREALREALTGWLPEGGEDAPWMDAVRRFRRREILRIGTRDICLQYPLESVVDELSALADTLLEAALARAAGTAEPAGLCIGVLGKLGGCELNYSSDIDLLGIAVGEGADTMQGAGRVLERVRGLLSDHTAAGYAYRVDLRLRPYGRAGETVVPLRVFEDYYRHKAALWEVQALLKARAVAGSPADREAFRSTLAACFNGRRFDGADIAHGIRDMRAKAVRQTHRRLGRGVDVKNDEGGIRDIEFLVQGLQLLHLAVWPDLLTGCTLEALKRLARHGILSDAQADTLRTDYIFLRRVEHCLQLLEDRQVHAIPVDPVQLSALAKRVGGGSMQAHDFQARVETVRERIHHAFGSIMSEIENAT